jgi:hypothetical protein
MVEGSPWGSCEGSEEEVKVGLCSHTMFMMWLTASPTGSSNDNPGSHPVNPALSWLTSRSYCGGKLEGTGMISPASLIQMWTEYVLLDSWLIVGAVRECCGAAVCQTAVV